MGVSEPQDKPFDIPKQLVWEAYKRVKANKGAAGVDRQSLEEFESDLRNNLYKIWNRMSSGTYFPPPVMAVEIPKKGGTRTLGVPTVGDRVAQTVAAMALEARTESIFHCDSYGYRPRRGALDALAMCRRRCWEKDWVIDLDVANFSTLCRGTWWSRRCRPTSPPARSGCCCISAVACRAAPAARRNPGASGTGEPLRVQRSHPSWLTCSCTTRSIPGWNANSRAYGSSATRMTRWCTARPSGRPVRCGPRSPSGWKKLGLRLHPGKTKIVYCSVS